MTQRIAKMEFNARIANHQSGKITLEIPNVSSANILERVCSSLDANSEVVVIIEYVKQ